MLIPIGINRFIVEINEVLYPNKISLEEREFFINKERTGIYNYPKDVDELQSTFKVNFEKSFILNFHGLSYILFVQLARKIYLLENSKDQSLVYFDSWIKELIKGNT